MPCSALLLQLLSATACLVPAVCGVLPATVPPAPGRTVQAQIDHAIAAGAASVTVAAGSYAFSGESLTIVGATDLHVVGWSVSLYFDCGYGVHIANSSSVTFEGFTQDYTAPCFASGVVRAVSSPADGDGGELWSGGGSLQSADIKFDLVNFLNPTNKILFPWAGTGGPPPLGAGSGVGGGGDPPSPVAPPPMNHISVKVTFWDPASTRMLAHGNHLFINATAVAAAGDPSVVRVTFSGVPVTALPAGSLATVHFRLGLADPATFQPQATGKPGALTYLITNCSGVRTLNHSLHGGGTEALVETGGEGGHLWRGVFLGRRPGQAPLRLLAANADGFHSSCVRVGPRLEDTELSWTGDDLLNIHSRISIVLRVLSDTAAYVIDAEGVSAPGDYDPSTLMLEQSKAGDTASFFTLHLAPLGNVTISSLRRVMEPAVVQKAKDAWSAINSPPYNQKIGHDFGHRVWLVNWTAALPLQQFSLVDVPRLRNNGAVMHNCHLHDGYMRFGLYDSPGATITNNLFERAFPMYVGESNDGWLEGPPVVNGVLVQGNTFIDTVARGAPIVVHNQTTHGVMVQNNVCMENGSTIPCY
jgi:hypothetical protein